MSFDFLPIGWSSDSSDEFYASVTEGKVEEVFPIGGSGGKNGVIIAILPNKLTIDDIE